MMGSIKCSDILVAIVILCTVSNAFGSDVGNEYDSLLLGKRSDSKNVKSQKDIFDGIPPPRIRAILTSLGSPQGTSATSEENIQKLANTMLQMMTTLENLDNKVDHLSAKLEASLFKQNDATNKQTLITNKFNTLQKTVDNNKHESADMQKSITDKINRIEEIIEKQLDVKQQLKSETVNEVMEQPISKYKGYFTNRNTNLPAYVIPQYNALSGALLTHAEISAIKEYSSLNVPENIKGVSTSRHDADQRYAQHIGECGGIIVAEKGKVYFVGDEEVGSNLRCVWTIRANRKSDVHIKLLEDDLGSDNYLTLSEYTDVYWNHNATLNSIRKKTAKIHAGDRETYVLDGPIIFVTLFYTRPARFSAKLPPSFKLYFEGIGKDVSTDWQFTHYHFTETEGAAKYPTELGALYKSNEVVTFVVNPREYPIYANITYADLEKDKDCYPDSLTFFPLYNSSTPYYEPIGPTDLNIRYCDKHSVNSRIGNPIYLDALIAIFKSDGGDEHAGFRFVWSSNDNLSPFHILQRWKH